MWYAIEGYDVEDALPKRLAARPAHLARLTALRDEGRLLLAGPCPAIDAEDPGPAGFSGSLVIAEFDSLESVDAWKVHPEHLVAQRRGREEFFADYRILVCNLIRTSDFTANLDNGTRTQLES